MKRPTQPILVLICLALFAPAQAAQAVAEREPAQRQDKPRAKSGPTKHPFLWRIEGRNGKRLATTSWLFGTMHLGDGRLTSLPDAVDKAIDDADAVYCELALDKINQLKITKMMLLPKGEKLSEIVPADVYALLDKHLRRLGSSAKRFDKMKVWGVSMVMAQLEAAKLGMTKSLDLSIYMDAKREDKEVGGLETMDEQLGAIGGASNEDQVKMLRSSLKYLDKLVEQGQSGLGMMLDAYLTGSEAKLLDVVESSMGDDDELNQRFLKPMLDDRNVRMTNRIVEKLEKNPSTSYFFAVGAAHYLGDMGMIELMRKKGYRITRVQPPTATWEEFVAMRTELQKLKNEVKRLKKQLAEAQK